MWPWPRWLLRVLIIVATLMANSNPAQAPAPPAVTVRDPRDLHSGVLVGAWQYCDQSYCVVISAGNLGSQPASGNTASSSASSSAVPLWLCTITVNDGRREGQPGEHVVSVRSTCGSLVSPPPRSFVLPASREDRLSQSQRPSHAGTLGQAGRCQWRSSRTARW